MVKYTYKEFKKASKWLMQYNGKTGINKIMFNLQLPIKYIIFKKVLKEELKNDKN